MIQKTLDRNLKIEQHEPLKKRGGGEPGCFVCSYAGLADPAPPVTHVMLRTINEMNII